MSQFEEENAVPEALPDRGRLGILKLSTVVDGIVKSKSLRSASEELTVIQLRHSFESHPESSDADGRARCTFVTCCVLFSPILILQRTF
jgi:hypothetical protein